LAIAVNSEGINSALTGRSILLLAAQFFALSAGDVRSETSAVSRQYRKSQLPLKRQQTNGFL
jgi:hypothetical protein